MSSTDPSPTAVSGPQPVAPQSPTGEFAVARLRACPSTANIEVLGGGMCNELACQNSFSLSVYPRAAWPHGHYKFVFTRDAQTVTCEGDLPLKSCDVPSIVCDAPGIAIVESGCALDATQHAFGDIFFEGYPLHVRVELFRDETRISDSDYTPAYQATQLQGPGCSAPCCGASADFTIPSGPV